MLVGYIILIIGFIVSLDQIWQLILISWLFGANYFSIPSHFVVYGSQLAFPIEQGTVAGYLFAFAQTFGFILGLILSIFLDGTRQRTIIAFSVIGLIMFISAALSFSMV